MSYYILDTLEKLEKFDKYLENKELLAVDTETNGLHFWKNVILGVSFATSPKKGFYLPLLTWIPDTSNQVKRKISKVDTLVYPNGYFLDLWNKEKYSEDVSPSQYKAPEFIVKYLKKWLSRNLILHNAPFDAVMFDSNFNIDITPNILCDTMLLKHALDENTRHGLKNTALLWEEDLKKVGVPIKKLANQEQIEVGESVVKNGGTFNKSQKHIWRADLDVMAKYAAADAYLTFGLFEVGLEKFKKDYEDKHLEWFFNDEVMPLCSEVIIPMKKRGVRIDVDYFKKMKKETENKLNELEDYIISEISEHIKDFDIGVSKSDIPKKRIIEKIIELEGLEYPTKITKGELKKSLAKAAVKEAYEKNPHWLWGYILGFDEIKYDADKMKQIENQVFCEMIKRRHHFNISSDAHLRWLFCKKLGHSQEELPQTDSATKHNPIASMKAEVLKSHFLNKYSWVRELLLYKKLKKLYTTYIIPALELHNNGYLHMDFVQSGTVSGRFACRGGFNLQTLPRAEEITSCSKCGSDNIAIENPIKIINRIKCNSCDNVEEEVSSSAIKQGFIAPEGYKIVNADFCLHPDTEILTKRGWKKVLEVNESDLVWQIDKDTLAGSWTRPKRVIKRHFAGKMFTFGNRRGTFSVTENHTMLWVGQYHKTRKDKEKYRLVTLSQEGIPRKGLNLAVGSTTSNTISNFSVWEIWMACMLQADAYYVGGKYRIQVSKPRKRRKVAELLGRAGKIHPIRKWHTLEVEEWSNIQFSSKLLAGKTLNPELIGSNQIDIFVEALAFWDGNINKNGRITWGSTDKTLVERIQIRLIQENYEASISRRVFDNENHNDFYTLSIKKGRRIRVRPEDCKESYYEGLVGCVTVDKGFIQIRSGGQTFVTGNCSLEPRCFAFMSGSPELKKVYTDGLDLYSKVYCDMMGEPYRNLKKSGESHLRQVAKVIALAIPYGSRARQVANLMGLTKPVIFPGQSEPTDVLDVEKGQYYINLYLNAYPDLKNYMLRQEMKALTEGQVETLVGRRRHLPLCRDVFKLLDAANIDYNEFIEVPSNTLKTQEINEILNKDTLKDLLARNGINYRDEKGIPRDWHFVRSIFKNEMNNAKNFPIQGLAAHITNRALLDVQRKFKEAGLDAWVVLQVHDEITCYAREDQAEKAVKLLKEAMENNKYSKLLDIPMEADPVICDTLKDSK